jgi:hypothetical protein
VLVGGALKRWSWPASGYKAERLRRSKFKVISAINYFERAVSKVSDLLTELEKTYALQRKIK